MTRPLFILIALIALAAPVSAYGVYLNCTPQTVSVGDPIKCSINTDYPVGTSMTVQFFEKQYTATLISSQTVTVQEDQQTRYVFFDTTGLPSGTYDVEIAWDNSVPEPRSGSQLIDVLQLINRAAGLTITSPLTQTNPDSLDISGSFAGAGNNGIKIQVEGNNSGLLFGPQYIPTNNNAFDYQVPIIGPDTYTVKFSDQQGLIGSKIFNVADEILSDGNDTILASYYDQATGQHIGNSAFVSVASTLMPTTVPVATGTAIVPIPTQVNAVPWYTYVARDLCFLSFGWWC